MTFPHVLSMVRWRLLLWPWPQFPLLALRPHLSRLRRFVGCPGCGTQAQNGVESWNFLRFLSVSPLNVLAKQSTFTSNNACVDNNVNTSLVFFHTNSCTTCNVSRSSPPGAPIDFRQEATIGLRRGDPFTTWRKSLGDFDIVWLPHWHNKTKMKRRLMRYPTAKKTPTRTGPTETHYPSCCWLALVCFSLDVDLMPYRVYSASWKQKCISVLPGHSQEWPRRTMTWSTMQNKSKGIQLNRTSRVDRHLYFLWPSRSVSTCICWSDMCPRYFHHPIFVSLCILRFSGCREKQTWKKASFSRLSFLSSGLLFCGNTS